MNIIDSLTSLVAPHICIGCGESGSVLCQQCMELYYEPLQPRCAGCKKLSDDFKVCISCKSWLPLKSVYVTSIYEGASVQLVRSLKFDCQRSAAIPIAEIMQQTISGVIDSPILCPIPTAPARIRERGFDHAYLISRHLSQQTGLELVRALQRHSNVRQLGASRTERMKQMETEFGLVKNSDVAGKDVLIVDDVMTTGATLASAARVLKNAGAKSVSAIVFAQKI